MDIVTELSWWTQTMTRCLDDRKWRVSFIWIWKYNWQNRVQSSGFCMQSSLFCMQFWQKIEWSTWMVNLLYVISNLLCKINQRQLESDLKPLGSSLLVTNKWAFLTVCILEPCVMHTCKTFVFPEMVGSTRIVMHKREFLFNHTDFCKCVNDVCKCQ